jgi:S-adenosylmethionine:diacylglycerol 3-amino-3-carboxypropyl transferase
MQHEEEIVRELQKRKYDWGNVYRLNLLDVLQWSQVDKNGDTWKQLVRSQQTSGKLLLNTVEVKPSGRKQVKITAEVDRETGEILPYGKVS